MKFLYLIILFAPFLITPEKTQGQEFPRGWVMYADASQGLATSFKQYTNYYVGELQLQPAYTIIPAHLRLGGNIGMAYTGDNLDGLFGVHLALLVKSLDVNFVGRSSVANLQVQAEQLWGTHQQQMFGLVLKAEVAQLAEIFLSGHRDYNLNNWWLQFGIGYNLLHKKTKKKPIDPFNPPKN
jgi:hypothetical protein